MSSVARSGLTSNELEDILSCNDEVLNDVFQYWEPPIRRLPPLIWVRIHSDLDSYLVTRGAGGARVTNWYHRQFTEAAKARYLSDDKQRIKLHKDMASYFMGNCSQSGGTEGIFKSIIIIFLSLDFDGNLFNINIITNVAHRDFIIRSSVNHQSCFHH